MPSETTSDPIHHGATVVITHRVRDGKAADYESWLKEIGPVCRTYPGYLDWHLVHPIAGLTTTYTVIVRFDTPENLRQWMGSSDRARLIDRVRPLLATDDTYAIRSGLDFFFTPQGSPDARVPVRWKQFLVTWSAIYPLVIVVPLAIMPLLRMAGLPDNHYLATLVITASVVFLMVYVVMPRYTKAVRKWLFD